MAGATHVRYGSSCRRRSCLTFSALAPRWPEPDRLPPEDLSHVRDLLVECGVPDCTNSGDLKLQELRAMYEPNLNGLSKLLLMPIPSWGVHLPPHRHPTMWDRISSQEASPDLRHQRTGTTSKLCNSGFGR